MVMALNNGGNAVMDKYSSYEYGDQGGWRMKNVQGTHGWAYGKVLDGVKKVPILYPLKGRGG